MSDLRANGAGRPDVGWNLDLVSWIALLILGILVIHQLMFPPIVGYADNGDFQRVLVPLGLTHSADPDAWEYVWFVDPEYEWTEPGGTVVFSSEILLAGLAVGLHKVFAGDDPFDLRTLGGVHAFFYLLGAYLVLAALQTFERRVRWLGAFCLLLAAADAPYVIFLNSFYGEAAALVFLATALGLLLREIRARSGSRVRTVIYYLVVALLATSKLQYAALALPLLVAPLLLWKIRRERGGGRLQTILGVAVIVVVAVLAARVPDRHREPIEYDALFNGVLAVSPDPATDLEEFGLAPELAEYAGTTAWTPGVPREVTESYGLSDVAGFYVRHPGRFVALAASSARHSFLWRDAVLANRVEPVEGPDGSQAPSVTGWCGLQRHLFPARLWFLGTVFALAVAGLVLAWRWRGGDTDARTLVAGGAAVVLSAALSFLVAVFAEGLTDMIKHLFLFQVLFDVGLVAVFCLAIDAVGRQLPGRWWEASAAVGRDDRRRQN